MPRWIEERWEWQERHAKDGKAIPLGNGITLYPDGATINSLDVCSEPPTEPLQLAQAKLAYEKAFADELENDFYRMKNALLSGMGGQNNVLHNFDWPTEYIGPPPSTDSVEALAHLRLLCRKRKAAAAKLQSEIDAHPTVVRQKELEAQHRQAIEQRNDMARAKAAEISAIVLEGPEDEENL
jgi:hypothetical protein